MLNLKITFVIYLFFMAANSKPINNEDGTGKQKKQLDFTPKSKLYTVFNNNNPDDSLIEKFLEIGRQPVYVYPFESYNIYFPLTQDDEDYSDYVNIDYAEEDGGNIYEIIPNNSDEPYEAIVVENEEINNLGPYLQYSMDQFSNELSKRDTFKDQENLLDLVSKNAFDKLTGEEFKNCTTLNTDVTNSALNTKPTQEKVTTTSESGKNTNGSYSALADKTNENLSEIRKHSIHIQTISDEKQKNRTVLNLSLPKGEVDGDDKNKILTNDYSTTKIVENMPLFVSNVLKDTEKNKSGTETKTSINPVNAMFEEFLSNFNQTSTASNTKQANHNNNIKPNKNRSQINKDDSTNPVWPSLFMEQMISLFVQQSLVSKTDHVAVYQNSRRNDVTNLKTSQSEKKSVEKIRGDIGELC